jgi:hypothetical protein
VHVLTSSSRNERTLNYDSHVVQKSLYLLVTSYIPRWRQKCHDEREGASLGGKKTGNDVNENEWCHVEAQSISRLLVAVPCCNIRVFSRHLLRQCDDNLPDLSARSPTLIPYCLACPLTASPSACFTYSRPTVYIQRWRPLPRDRFPVYSVRWRTRA